MTVASFTVDRRPLHSSSPPQPAAVAVRNALLDVEIKPPRIPVYANTTGTPHTSPESIREELVKQLTSPVRWEDGILGMRAAGVGRFYDMGPKRGGLGSMLRRIDPAIGRAATSVPVSCSSNPTIALPSPSETRATVFGSR